MYSFVQKTEWDWRERGLLAPVPISATGSALRLHPCRALSSAQSVETITACHTDVNGCMGAINFRIPLR